MFIGNQSISSEYVFQIKTLSEMLIIGRLCVLWPEIHSQDVLLFIIIYLY